MFNNTMPSTTGAPLLLPIEIGRPLFVLGANGTGKSSLMQRLFRDNTQNAYRISAHRQTWFNSGSLTLSPEQKRQTETNIKSNDINDNSRWRDDYSAARASIAIYDLIDAENVRARSIAAAVDSDEIDMAKELAKHDAPIRVINELLSLSNLPITISVSNNDTVMASKSGSPLYSIAELSDGERNALLIAAGVLTAKEGSLIIVDEPER